MKAATFLAALSCASSSVHAHYGLWIQHPDDSDEHLYRSTIADECNELHSTTGPIEAWYMYDRTSRSFGNLAEFAPNMSNRATLIGVQTAGEEYGTDTSFGFVFGSTAADSPAGSAAFSCSSGEWRGLKNRPIRVLDDDDDSAEFDAMNGRIQFTFNWGVGETDGVLLADVRGRLVCRPGNNGTESGLAMPIGVFEDVPNSAPNELRFNVTTVPWEQGTRLEFRQTCSILNQEPGRPTMDAVRVEFTLVEGVDGEATGNVYLWYNAARRELEWRLDLDGLSSDIRAVNLFQNDMLVTALGNDMEYHFQPTGTFTLSAEQHEALNRNELRLVVNTVENMEGEIAGPIRFNLNLGENAGFVATVSSFALLASTLLAVLLA